MISMIPHVLLSIGLYAVIEAGYYNQSRGILHGSSSRINKDDEKASSCGQEAVDNWTMDWFEPISSAPLQSTESRRIGIDQVKRGNVEVYLAAHVFQMPLKDVLGDSSKHHILIGLVSDLERARGRRFPSGLNLNIGLIFVVALRGIWSKVTPILRQEATSSPVHILEGTSVTVAEAESKSTAIARSSTPHQNTHTRAIPPSSLSMVCSLSNLSSIGLCSAPPLRIRQRSRTIDAVIACAQAQIPLSSLAMMSSLSNLSSIGMCTAPPLRVRQRSSTTSFGVGKGVIGYASAVPFVSAGKAIAK